MKSIFSLAGPSKYRKLLLKWYHAHARDLPWRRTKDPYRIWVSEIMLQQTQVETVIPYYKKWLRRFPDLKSLAQAGLPDVLKHWAGLGYYRRARMLHEAARRILRDKNGKIPESAEELMKLPGIGRYTAGAIASIAFGEPAPVLDGNVKRVLARIYAVEVPQDKPQGEKILWDIASRLVANSRRHSSRRCQAREKVPGTEGYAGDLNQALMELGATICFPATPRCELCPVSKFCKAHKLRRENAFPVTGNKSRMEKKKSSALILRQNGKILIQKQQPEARWGGLWTFPFSEGGKSNLRTWGVSPKSLRRRLTLRHGFTKYLIQLDVYEHRMETPEEVSAFSRRPGMSKECPQCARLPHPDRAQKKCPHIYRWVKRDHLLNFAFPSPHQKIADDLMRHGR